jgi:hypothetical protein
MSGFRRLLRIPPDGLAVLVVLASSCGVLACGLQEGREGQSGAVSAHCTSIAYNPVLTDAHVRELEQSGYVVVNDVLTSEEVRRAFCDAKLVMSNRSEASPNNDLRLRTDKVCFMTQSDRDRAFTQSLGQSGFALLHAQMTLRGVGSTLVRRSFKGFGSEDNDQDRNTYSQLRVPDLVQLSKYAKSSTFYRPHRDGVSGSFLELGLLQWLKLASYRARVVTAILYLNADDPTPWSEQADGGCLRMHLGTMSGDDEGTSAVEVRNISPLGGRLVLFDSQRVLHEVLPTHRDRFALTVWFTL